MTSSELATAVPEMRSATRITAIDDGLIDAATETLTAAFLDDAVYARVFPDECDRRRAFKAMWKALTRYSMRWGEAQATDSGDGVALWLPPGATRTTVWRMMRSGLWRAVGRFPSASRKTFLSAMGHLGAVHKELMPEDHYYLWALGVRPESQGLGIGTSLMRPVLERADREGFPVYLEAIAEANSRYYERRGFELLREGSVPGQDFPYWAMVKRPAGR